MSSSSDDYEELFFEYDVLSVPPLQQQRPPWWQSDLLSDEGQHKAATEEAACSQDGALVAEAGWEQAVAEAAEAADACGEDRSRSSGDC